MQIGYARVSTHDQNLDLQKDALKKAGCEKVIVDVASGKKEKHSGLDRARTSCGRETSWSSGGSTAWVGR